MKYTKIRDHSVLQFFLLLSIILIQIPIINSIFSIAWWRPYLIQSTPQTISLFFGLLAIAINEFGVESKHKIGSIILFFMGSIFHPSIGFFTIIFYFLSNYVNFKLSFFIKTIIFGIILPFILLKLLFISNINLSNKDFVNIYCIENHSSHYHLSDFGSLTPYSWKFSFFIELVFFLIPMAFFLIKKDWHKLFLSLFFCVSFISSLALQFLFIDLFPSKIFAMIGPIRFTQFAYWMIVILWIIFLSPIFKHLNFNFKLNFNKYFFYSIIFIYLIIGVIYIDNPKSDRIKKDPDFYKFLSRTDENSVFSIFLSDFTIDVPNIGNRASFIGNGFPFNEDYFAPFQNKMELLYGSREFRDKLIGNTDEERKIAFYRNLLPLDFVNISAKYQLDYVIIEKKFSNNFKMFSPKFENERLKIYSVNDFKNYLNK